MKRRLILLRHGQSVFNKDNLFTGWTDVSLSEQGEQEASKAGQLLMKNNIFPDICFTSWLKRAIDTTDIALKEMDWEHIDIIKSWKLNERHYGTWQQQNKAEIQKKVGDKFFLSVRRGYDTPPPPLPTDDERLPQNNSKYRDVDPNILPLSESLKDTKQRTIQYLFEAIISELAQNKTVLVSAHGNSLRSLVMYFDKLNEEEITKVEIATGVPIVYELSEDMKVIKKSILN